MRELTRITKPNGYVITVNPVNWAYHANPVDCWRIFPEGAKALHEECGLKTVVAEYGHLDPTSMNQPRAYPLSENSSAKPPISPGTAKPRSTRSPSDKNWPKNDGTLGTFRPLPAVADTELPRPRRIDRCRYQALSGLSGAYSFRSSTSAGRT